MLLALVFNDSTTPISPEAVVEDFRGEAIDATPVPTDTMPLDTMPLGTVPPSQPAQNISGLLIPGVYLYDTSGDEGIDALNGTRHLYPDVTTVMIQTTACGAMYRWAALEERTQEWELCRAEAGLELVNYTSFHRFFGQDDLRVMTCDEPLLLVPTEVVVGATSSTTCTGGTLIEEWAVAVVGIRDENVAGASVMVVEVDVDIAVDASDNSITGSYDATYWFGVDTGLLVRWTQASATTADTAVGSVNYDEQFDLGLTDVHPET